MCLRSTFLSTLSLRRATSPCCGWFQVIYYFYPRSPCGERLARCRCWVLSNAISIHALLAESDKPAEHHANSQQEFLSTLSLRRATWSRQIIIIIVNDFYPRSPCGERPIFLLPLVLISLFLSTLSLRRATLWACLVGFAS